MSVPKSGRISGVLDASVNLGLIPLVLLLDDQAMAGTAAVKADLAGTLDSPHLSGRMTINGGRYENQRTGTLLKDISAEITADGSRVRLVKFIGSDGERGKVTLEGSGEIDPKKKHPYQLKVHLNEARLIRLDLFHGASSGTLDLGGNAAGARLSGRLVVDDAEFRIPQKLPPQITEVEVTEINTGRTPAKNDGGARPALFNLALDVTVEAPGRVYVRGRGLESEWAGTLQIAGQASAPIVRGGLSVRRGVFSFLDRQFKFKSGSLAFGGSSPPAPWLDALAETQVKDVTVQVHVLGPVKAPEIELASDPHLPDDEIMARVLFGRALAGITPLQALRLAETLQQMTGGPGLLPDFAGKTREILGVDRLEVEPDEEGGVKIGAGKYIHEKVYVEAEKGSQPGEDKVRVEVDLTPNLGMESEVGSEGQGGIRFNWKMDY
jgi:translocation and assembly module TamB